MSRSSLIGTLGVALCLPAATVARLGVRLIEQDRALEAQRMAESRAAKYRVPLTNASELFAVSPAYSCDSGGVQMASAIVQPRLFLVADE